MAKSGAAKKRKAGKPDARIMPTAEAMQHGEFTSVGMAYRRVPMIEVLYRADHLNEREYRALAHYRDQATLAERSPLKSCLDYTQSGGGDIPLSAAITSAMLETSRIERDMGALAPLARAIAVEDKSISRWCIDQYGGRERYGPGGKFIAVVPVNEKLNVRMANMELRMAAHRIAG
jgi:hypothetical protein